MTAPAGSDTSISIRSVKVVVRCANLESSRSFYASIIGLKTVEQWEEKEGRGLILAVGDSGSALIEMYEMTTADGRFDPRFRERFPSDKIDLQLETNSVDDWARQLAPRWPFRRTRGSALGSAMDQAAGSRRPADCHL
jgi:catechol 2,3-dioxygenase-like lactoylglutathione lyase family enzyme